MRFVRVNRIETAGLRAQEDRGQSVRAENGEWHRLVPAGQKVGSVGERGGALPADDGLGVQRDRHLRLEIERGPASVFHGGQVEYEALVRDAADNRFRRGLLAAVGVHLQAKSGVRRRSRVYAQGGSPDPEKEKEQRKGLSHANPSSSRKKHRYGRFILP